MITFLRNPLFRQNLLHKPFFCISDSLREHIDRYKAILASELIQTIRKSPFNEYRTEKPYRSLRQTLLDRIGSFNVTAQDREKKEEVASTVKYALRRYFEDGVWVPSYLCSQKIFTDKTEILYNNVTGDWKDHDLNLEGMSPEDLANLSVRKMKFCPTYLITGTVFRQICGSSKFSLLRGEPAIGKSNALLLYSLLSDLVFRYRFKYNKTVEEFKKQIKHEIPKAFYCSVNLDQHKDYSSHMDFLMKRQLYEFIQNNSSNGTGKVEQKIKDFYHSKYNVSTVMIMDQVNEMARAKRRFDEELAKEIQTFQQNSESNFDQARTKCQRQSQLPQQKRFLSHQNTDILQSASIKRNNLIATEYKKSVELQSELHQMIQKNHFDRFLCMSSTEAELDLIKKLNLKGLDREQKVEAHIKRIYSPKKLFGDIAISDSVDMFMFFLKRRLFNSRTKKKLEENEHKLLKDIKEYVNKYIKKDYFGYFSFQSIRQVMENQLNEEKHDIDSWVDNPLEVQSKVLQIMKLVEKKSVKELKSKIMGFLTDKHPNKRFEERKPLLLAQLWGQSVIFEQQAGMIGKQLSQGQQDKLKQILNSFPKLVSESSNVSLLKELEQAISHKLFNYDNDKIYCLYNPMMICRIMQENRQSLSELILASSDSMVQEILKNKTCLKQLIKSGLIDIFSKEKTMIEIGNKILRTTYTKIGGFLSIPNRDSLAYKDFRFVQSLKKCVRKVHQGKQQFQDQGFVVLPAKETFKNSLDKIIQRGIQSEQIRQKNELIDFMFCEYKRFERNTFLQVYAFVVATGQKEHEEKIERFMEEFIKFKDIYEQFQLFPRERKINVHFNYRVITTAQIQDFCCERIIGKLIQKYDNDYKLEGQKREQRYNQRLIFKRLQTIGNKNIVNISNEKISYKTFLSSIGAISLNDIELSNKNEEAIKLQKALIDRIKRQVAKQ